MTHDNPASSQPLLHPSVAVGVGAVLVYALVTNSIQLSSGISYLDWFKTAASTWRVGVLSLAAGSSVLLAFVLRNRWRHLWSDPFQLRTTRVMKLAMVVWWVTIAVRLAGVKWSEIPQALLVAVLVSGVLVGFAEETLFRGIFLRCMRESGRNEAAAAIWTSVAFGLFHLPNMFMGMGMIGAVQIVLAALSGGLLYVFRRQYGVIWPAMVAHGAWDISTFLSGGFSSAWLAQATLPMMAAQIVLGIGVLVSIYRHDRQTVVLPAAAR